MTWERLEDMPRGELNTLLDRLATELDREHHETVERRLIARLALTLQGGDDGTTR